MLAFSALPNPYKAGDFSDVVYWQIFEDVKASYPLTFEQLIEQMIYCDRGEEPTDSLVRFVERKVNKMVSDRVLLKMGDVLAIPAKRTREKIEKQKTEQTELVF